MNRLHLFDDPLDAAPEHPEPNAAAAPASVMSSSAIVAAIGAAPDADADPEPLSAVGLPTEAPAVLHDGRQTEPPPAIGLERDHMAWPPAGWEDIDPSWRTDLSYPPEPSSPAGHGLFDAAPAGAVGSALPWPDLGVGEAHAATSSRRWMREALETVFLALLIFLGIRVFVLQFKIEGTSMSPTMADGEYILVNRLSYRLFGEPRRGDIIVFESWTPGKDYIKRVIGLPGQRVEVHDMEVFIDGERIDEAYLASTTTSGDSSVILGPEEYFVMGDNRDNSQDSRALGALQGAKIIGKAWLIYWPVRSMGLVPDADQDRPITTDPTQG